MPLVLGYDRGREVYDQAARRGWVLPCFCSENLTTTEAILSAAEDFAVSRGYERVPVTLAITIRYPHRSQASYYTHTRRWDTGLALFRADAEALTRENGPFPHVDALLHLDHAQHDLDEGLLSGDLSGYSSVMYDASAVPFDENIEKTAAFVKKMGGRILIEGACDEIVDATGTQRSEITTPERAERFLRETGADFIVANLGTEHRASGHDLHYRGDAARAIRARVGGKIVLHGCSSVPNEEVAALFSDGVCKVNIWTSLERDSSPALLERMVKNASLVAGDAAVRALVAEGYLTEKCLTGQKPSLEHFTTTARQACVFERMKALVTDYLTLWYA